MRRNMSGEIGRKEEKGKKWRKRIKVKKGKKNGCSVISSAYMMTS
jgi:hypothetical protein